MHPRYVFIVNPRSGAGKGERVAETLDKVLAEHPILREGMGQIFTVDELDAGRLCRVLAGAEAVVAVGGDGTVSYLLPHILACESPPALGLIPLGTSNDLARALGVSVRADYTDAETLRRTLDGFLDARHENLDVLSVNQGRFFCNYLGIGFDAAIVRDFDDVRTSRLAKLLPPGRLTNNLLYFLLGLKNAGFYLKPPVEIAYGNEQGDHRTGIDSPCRAIIVSNLPVYAGGCPISPDARTDDGLFEMTLVRTIWQFILLILSRFLPFVRLPRRVARYRARWATIRLTSPAPFQIDGEKGSDADALMPSLNISIHASLHVLTPRRPM